MNSSTPVMLRRLPQLLQKPWFRVAVNVVGAMVLWGSWAAIVHYAHPLLVQLKAAATQAAISGTFTLLGAAVLEAIFARTAPRWRVPVSGLSTFLFIFCSVIIIHQWAGTPNIILTIAPTMTLSFFYCLGYAASLARLEASASGNA